MQKAEFSKYASLDIQYKGISFPADLKDLLKTYFELSGVQSSLSTLTKMSYCHSALNSASTTSWSILLKLSIHIKSKIHFKNPYFCAQFHLQTEF